ncbi:EIF3C [Cordylochernes scorpioides]|uniref:EIF3C n=1 Tax=Cordylochernes scorpioides TaxID=51811 RepID=A0ABY6L1U1_9ARAC|nr:EIF3C [Cordylochernes scorpioides]
MVHHWYVLPPNLGDDVVARTPEKEEEAKKAKKKREKREKKQDEDGGEWEEVKGGVPLIMEKPKMFSKDAEITHPVVLRKLNEILAARGKKGTDRSEQIDLLVELLKISDKHNLGPGLGLKIMFAIISAIYDYNANIATCMKPEMWQQ